jgi:dTDP-4-amino-4,6-dideoxygalactose transaminase
MIRFIRPTIPAPEHWLPYVREAYQHRWFSNFGPLATRLEHALVEKFRPPGREAVLVANCTAGLTAALLALDVKGKVVVPSFTFPATAQAVLQAGCQPIFCDVSPRTWELDPHELDRLLGVAKAAAVIHVRAFGFCRDLEAIELAVARHGIPLVIDAAAALGAERDDGQPAGSQGDLEVFSLHATKVFAVGEGGVVFAPPGLAARIRTAINFGIHAGDVTMPGFNAKFSEFHAAVGLAVLDSIDGYLRRRRAIATTYRRAVAQFPHWTNPVQTGLAAWQTYPLLLPADVDAEAMVVEGRRQGVEFRRYYSPALHECSFPGYEAQNSLATSSLLASRMLCLPVYSDMTPQELDVVLGVLRNLASLSSAAAYFDAHGSGGVVGGSPHFHRGGRARPTDGARRLPAAPAQRE